MPIRGASGYTPIRVCFLVQTLLFEEETVKLRFWCLPLPKPCQLGVFVIATWPGYCCKSKVVWRWWRSADSSFINFSCVQMAVVRYEWSNVHRWRPVTFSSMKSPISMKCTSHAFAYRAATLPPEFNSLFLELTEIELSPNPYSVFRLLARTF